MKPIIVALLLVAGLWAGAGFGQVEVEWEYRYNRSRGNDGNPTKDVCTDFIRTSDGCYVLAGYSEIEDIRHNDFWIVKTDSMGRLLWSRNYGGSGNDLCQRVVELPNNDLLLCGKTTTFGGGVLIIRTDSSGDSLWSQRISGQYIDIPFDFCINENELLIIGALTAYYTGDDYEGNPIWEDRLVMRKMNTEGEIVVSCLYPGIGHWDGQSVLSLDNDGYLVSSGGSGYGGLFRLDEELDSLWLVRYEREYENFFIGLVAINQDGFAIAGWGRTGGVSAKIWLLRTDSHGDTLWTRVIGNQSQSHTCNSIIQTIDNGFALVGDRWDGINTANAGGILVKTDSIGEVQWTFVNGDGSTEFNRVIEKDDGSFLLAGKRGPYGRVGDADYFLLKTTPDPVTVRKPSSNFELSEMNLFSAYPNPFNSTLNIGFSGPINREATGLFIVDPLGRKVAEFNGRWKMENGTRGSVVWNAEGLPAGKYVIYLTAGNQTASQSVTLLK